MTDTPETTNSPPREQQTITPTDVGDAATVLGITGVAAPAVAGEVASTDNQQDGAAPTAQQPAENDPSRVDASDLQIDPAASTQEPTGPAPDEKAPTAAILGAGEAATVAAAGPGPVVEYVHEVPNRREVVSQINAIEQLALFWGGDTGTKIRNHVGRLRELLAIV